MGWYWLAVAEISAWLLGFFNSVEVRLGEEAESVGDGGVSGIAIIPLFFWY